MAASQAGLVTLTKIVEHACKLIIKYRTRMDALIAAAVAAGHITAAQQTTLESWLDATQGACLILKAVTGY